MAGVCDCFPGYAGAACDSCSADARTFTVPPHAASATSANSGANRNGNNGNDPSPRTCIPHSWIPQQAALQLGRPSPPVGSNSTPAPSAVTAVTTTAPTVSPTSVSPALVWWPAVVVGIILALMLALCFAAWLKKRTDKEVDRLRRGNKYGLAVSKAVVPEYASDGENSGDEWGAGGKTGGNTKSSQSGWLWKKSRVGFNGKQVWQQWHVSLAGHTLRYSLSTGKTKRNSSAAAASAKATSHKLGTDAAGARTSSRGNESFDEVGQLDLRHASYVLVRQQDHRARPSKSSSSAAGRWRFDIVLRTSKMPPRETADALDRGVVHSRDGAGTTGAAAARIVSERFEFMAESRHDLKEWTQRLAKETERGILYDDRDSGSVSGSVGSFGSAGSVGGDSPVAVSVPLNDAMLSGDSSNGSSYTSEEDK